ncbi:hypothetical protein A1O1_04517 [Capronia coronata CBS 617.96]|uniref:Uncharacterized protein n=1 Tax=Capronia coronata CBS 617.96 TaxID=1182541 RepID=W9YP30_9EURO|nr:uncharacterized protein A1O1_04517 [Capronia coronata CBS 617.96]EXJ91405.1 hypothetical protein A1O1_04517 [Capronia coronata CBS 617.96]
MADEAKEGFPALPSLIAFGSLNILPAEHQLQELRTVLQHQIWLKPVSEAIYDLPVLWRALAAKETRLDTVVGKSCADQLAEWLSGGVVIQESFRKQNAMTMTITVISQVVQYFTYLQQSDRPIDHSSVLKSVTAGGGIQGFCAGLLTALAVASGQTEGGVGKFAAVSIRLAFCIGTYVDLDQGLTGESSKYSTLAVRCKAPATVESIERLLNIHPNTYIAVDRDVRDVTITAPTLETESLLSKLTGHGLSVLDTGLSGRYHSITNKDVPANILDVIQRYLTEGFGSRDLVRSNTDGQVLCDDNVVLTILKSILVDRAKWHSTISIAADSLRSLHGKAFILAIGADAIPPSIARAFPVTKISLSLTHNSLARDSDISAEHPVNIPDQDAYPENAIAVIGMSCKFPGADSIDEFWAMLTEGKSMLAQIPSQRFKAKGLPRAGDNLRFWGNFISDIEAFDHKFFKKSAREAASMDPQQRLLLQLAYEALESSGYFADSSRPRDIGCYVGACSTDYDNNVASHPPTAYATTGTLRAFLSGRISHYFGWSGPSLVFDTACSSSAVAIHTACKALQSGECSQALAGGVTLMTSPYLYENLSAAHFLSPSGATKPFDAKADGYCRGEGVGLVVLKKLSDALTDGDDILGVIAGSAINQNKNCVSITVPHSDSQSELYNRVAKQAGVAPQNVTFVEAHGTGTPVGDPIEMESIRQVFGRNRRSSPLFVSSVKGNIGHLEGASGVAGLIKAILQIQYRTACLQASFQSLSPKIPALEPDNLCIPTSNRTLPIDRLTACINNYGAAGSNAAMILLEGPRKENPVHDVVDSSIGSILRRYPVQITASSVASLLAYCRELNKFCEEKLLPSSEAQLLADLAFRLARRQNQELGYMLNLTASTIGDLQSQLQRQSEGFNTIMQRPKAKATVLCFGGQVSDCIALSKRIWEQSALLRSHLNACDNALRSMGYPGLYPGIFQLEALTDVVALHSAIFALQYASAQAWIDSGLKVDALVGHSIGQITALCVSGQLSLRDGLTLIAGRATLMRNYWGTESGTMIAVEADEQTIEELTRTLTSIDPLCKFEIACYNGPTSHVIVSDRASADRLEVELALRKLRHKRLKVPYGFHSRFTDPLIPHLEELASKLKFQDAKIHLETCSKDASWVKATPQAVAQHTRDPVFFGQAVQRLRTRLGPCTWIEAGSDSSIVAMVRRAIGHTPDLPDSFFPVQLNKTDSLEQLVDTTLGLSNCGQQVQFWNFHRSQASDYGFLRLPSYQFEKSRHWLELITTPLKDEDSKIGTGVVAPIQPTVEPAVLLRLVRSDSQGHRFSINPTSDEYQAMVKGHVVLGTPQCPPVMYLEMVTRALHVIGKPTPHSLLSLTDFNNGTPLGIETTRDIDLHVEAHLDGSWSFKLTSKLASASQSGQTDPEFHASGSLSLEDNVKSVQDEFARYERLIGHKKISTIWGDDGSERIQGTMVYKVFAELVQYAGCYRGLRGMAAKAGMVAGRVSMPCQVSGPTNKSSVHAHILDSFFQIPMLHSNYVMDCVKSEIFRLEKVGRLQWGLGFVSHDNGPPPESTWDVLAFSSTEGEDVVYDMYIFNAATGTLVMLVLGVVLIKGPSSSVANVLSRDSRTSTDVFSMGQTAENSDRKAEFTHRTTRAKVSPSDGDSSSTTSTSPGGSSKASPATSVMTTPSTTPSAARIMEQLSRLVAEHLEIEGQVSMDTNLVDHGLDSLLSIELGSDIMKLFSVELDMEKIHYDFTFGDLLKMVLNDGETPEDFSGKAGAPSVAEPKQQTLASSTISSARVAQDEDGLLKDAHQIFEGIRFDFDKYAGETGFKDFWTKVYPMQANLVVCYVVEAFRKLGCNLTSLKTGQRLPTIKILPKHSHLLEQLHNILVDEGLIEHRSDSTYARTARPLDPRPAAELFKEMLLLHPAHASETKLLNVTGSCLAECMTGQVDPLPLLFANRSHREIVADVYDQAPMCQASTRLLADFLGKIFANQHGVFRILEVGAGTGGTARYLVDFLAAKGIDFEYTFTDISPSLVAAARKKFAGKKQMRFFVLDCDRPATAELHDQFHVVIATNCIHATPNAGTAAANIAPMLRDTGIFCLVEFTRGLYWFDLVYGLLEGWWLFSDGRRHALGDQWFWNKSFKAGGYKHVSWTDGITNEAQTMRLIAAFKHQAPDSIPRPLAGNLTKRAGIPTETFTWKHVGKLSLQADVYYPKTADEPGKKRPIALMIHGGGHFLYGRRDIPMKHVRVLIQRGFLPVSVDYRLCPETTLLQGPVADCCEALCWARRTLPFLELGGPAVTIDPGKLIALGWSSGGHLAMTLGYTAASRGVKPPEVILPFYSPTDLESDHWDKPIYPKAAEEEPTDVWDFLDGVCDEPILDYTPVTSKKTASLSLTLQDDRARIILHLNWKAQTLPVMFHGLPSKNKVVEGNTTDWKALPKPAVEQLRAASPYWQILQGAYCTPTFMVHGNHDDWVPWQMSQRTIEALKSKGVEADIEIADRCGHAFDLFTVEDPLGTGWAAVEHAYDFACRVLSPGEGTANGTVAT